MMLIGAMIIDIQFVIFMWVNTPTRLVIHLLEKIWPEGMTVYESANCCGLLHLLLYLAVSAFSWGLCGYAIGALVERVFSALSHDET
jgi:hypothetical protein